ncbi:diacylglycerol/lipid kinase family protein [Corynebacterium tapiri]|uniref:DAGKc domain-containing protein n=1 Tax=Corynebacterium tapiri TaxID=1448266 RepID=A0A5C4U3J6_9CORY|nr:diacylglycerol kinase family protein [Corynebacterium tapiri]TNL97648.1 hypothetical protein FHE74_06065 [Corynebacterium tapiri]
MSHNNQRAVIVFNPVKIEREELEPLVKAAASKHGWQEPEWVETTEDDPGEGQAKEAAADGADMVLACGGDGTVRAVSTGLRDTEAAMGIIPQGTGNLLARNLGLPLGMEKAIDVAFGGADRVIDFCAADVVDESGEERTIPFAVMAGVGIDAQMIENTDDDLKKKTGVFAYAVAVIKSLGGGNRLNLTYRIDEGEETKTRAHSVIVGNCGELIGAIELIPDAEPDDGLIDLLIMRPKGVFGWIPIICRIAGQIAWKYLGRGKRFDGAKHTSDDVHYATGHTVSVELSQPEVFEVDGDTVGKVRSFAIRLDPLSLSVRVPQDA